MPTSGDPYPDDPIRPSRAATILGVRVRAIYRRIERGQLRAWRDQDTGQLRVSEADVRGKWRREEGVARPAPGRPLGPAARERVRAAAAERARQLGLLPPAG